MCQQPNLRSTTTPKMLPSLELKKQVRFNEVQQQCLAPNREDLDCENLFYTPLELQIQKEQDIEAKRCAEYYNYDEEESMAKGLCFRGLEYSLNRGERRRRIRKYIKTVLEVQVEQKELQYKDEYELYIVARTNSKKDRKRAQKWAAQDADDAALLALEDSMSSSSSSTSHTMDTSSSSNASSGESNNNGNNKPQRKRRSFKKLLSSSGGMISRVFSSKSLHHKGAAAEDNNNEQQPQQTRTRRTSFRRCKSA